MGLVPGRRTGRPVVMLGVAEKDSDALDDMGQVF